MTQGATLAPTAPTQPDLLPASAFGKAPGVSCASLCFSGAAPRMTLGRGLYLTQVTSVIRFTTQPHKPR